jgi:hypothetical protein
MGAVGSMQAHRFSGSRVQVSGFKGYKGSGVSGKREPQNTEQGIMNVEGK